MTTRTASEMKRPRQSKRTVGSDPEEPAAASLPAPDSRRSARAKKAKAEAKLLVDDAPATASRRLSRANRAKSALSVDDAPAANSCKPKRVRNAKPADDTPSVITVSDGSSSQILSYDNVRGNSVDVGPDCSVSDSFVDEDEHGEDRKEEEEEEEAALPNKRMVGVSENSSDNDSSVACSFGDPIPEEEARRRWPERYEKRCSLSSSMKRADYEEVIRAIHHYRQATVDGCVYNLYDDAYVKAGDGDPHYNCRIMEFFEAANKELYFTAQWFFRVEDTVIQDHAHRHRLKVFHDSRRVFLSEEKNENKLDCIVSKIKIVKVDPNIDSKEKEQSITSCDLYYDMSYSLAYSTFANLPPETRSESSSTVYSDITVKEKSASDSEGSSGQMEVLSLLDLYSGCGAMSTGICLGANLSGVNLHTRWTVDINQYACKSLKHNHPDTEVRNEKAEDFLSLLVEWEKLCTKYQLAFRNEDLMEETELNEPNNEEPEESSEVLEDESEVEKLIGICYGDPQQVGEKGLKFKVRWKGYGQSEDTWDPLDGLSNCEEKIKNGYKKSWKGYGQSEDTWEPFDGLSNCEEKIKNGYKKSWKGYGPSEDTWEPLDGLSNCEEKIINGYKESWKGYGPSEDTWETLDGLINCEEKIKNGYKKSWKGYGPSEDTWEPLDGLSNCEEKIKNGYKKSWKGYGPSEDTWEPLDGLSNCEEKIINGYKNSWKGYGPSEDTWEPLDELSNCEEKIINGYKKSWKGYGPSEDKWEPLDGLSNCEEKIKNGYKKSWKGYGPSEDTWETLDGLSNCEEKIINGYKNSWKGYGPSEDTWEPLDRLSNCEEKIINGYKNSWKGYGPSEDTWEPLGGLSNCEEKIVNGYKESWKGYGPSEDTWETLDGLSNCEKKIKNGYKKSWKGYGPSEDTWESLDRLSNCEEKIRDFVINGYKKNLLPLPGDADVICGGPPCQGVSGFNRFRNKEDPLQDEKNKQLIVFMDIVEFLKPKYVLMENVVDILKFAHGFLGRYALSRLVSMNYQARLGMMVAGNYGLPQFRMRVFLWGARPTEVLPQFPLPTHEVVVRGNFLNEFERNMVAYDENQHRELEKELLLGDAISDLSVVSNDESRDEMPYGSKPGSEFQQYIRLTENGCLGQTLYDHRPLQLNEDDYRRVSKIPKRKGANFRDLPGVLVNPDNTVMWDPNVERVLLPSGKPLVPSYAMSFMRGKSTKPFGRLWWDETVPTVVTRAEPHNQIIIHPLQDRVLTIRENARLQGFPDHYKLFGPVKERYIQVGNAVAVPVAKALGYMLGRALQGHAASQQPLYVLPKKFHTLGSRAADTSEIIE